MSVCCRLLIIATLQPASLRGLRLHTTCALSPTKGGTASQQLLLLPTWTVEQQSPIFSSPRVLPLRGPLQQATARSCSKADMHREQQSARAVLAVTVQGVVTAVTATSGTLLWTHSLGTQVFADLTLWALPTPVENAPVTVAGASARSNDEPERTACAVTGVDGALVLLDAISGLRMAHTPAGDSGASAPPWRLVSASNRAPERSVLAQRTLEVLLCSNAGGLRLAHVSAAPASQDAQDTSEGRACLQQMLRVRMVAVPGLGHASFSGVVGVPGTRSALLGSRGNAVHAVSLPRT